LLIDSAAGAQPQRLELVSTAGVHQRYLPGSTPQAGTFEGPVLYLPGGSAFLIGSGHGFAVISNNGTVIRQIPSRPAFGSANCISGKRPETPLPPAHRQLRDPDLVLFSVDLHTGKTFLLLGQGLNGGSVMDVKIVKTW